MQNDMPMTIHRSKSKPEIEIQYGGRPFSKTGSSFISAMDWGISSKFGMQIEFHILKQILSLNQNPEVHFRLYGRHLEKSIWRHYSAEGRPITTKFGRQMQSDMPLTIHGWKSKLEIEFQYGGRPFSETGSSYVSLSAVDWVMSSKFGMQIHFHLLKHIPSLIVNPEVHFRLYGRHLEKSIWRHNSADNRLLTTKFSRQMQNGMPMTIHHGVTPCYT